MLELFTKWLDDIATFDCILRYVSFESRGEGTAFNDLYLKICDVEDKLKFKHFKHNKNDLNNFLLSLANVWYRELFRDCLRNVIQQYRSILTNEGMKESFAKLSKLVCDNGIEYIAQRPSMGYGNFLGYMGRFFKGADVLQLFQDFYEPLRSREIHDALRETYKPVTDDMKMEILSEKITQIIIREKMNIEGASQLNKIIRGAGLFEKQQKCQFVYIDNGRVISGLEALNIPNICGAMVFDCVPNGRMELFSASKTMTEHAKCQRLTTFTYNRSFSDTSLMSSVSNDEIFTKSHETTITLVNRDERGWDIADSTHRFVRNMCIVNNKSSIMNTLEIFVNNEAALTLIIVIIQKAIEYSGEIVSLIYDMPVADQKKNGSDTDNLRCIKCHNNVPILFLDSLKNCLLRSLTSDTVLNCPNLFVMNNFDIIYFEHIITNKCPSELTSQDLTAITQWYDCEGCHYAGRKPRVTIGQILESKDENIFNIKILEKSIEKLGISMAEYNDGIRAFLLNKGVINITDLESSASKHQLSREINIFATKHHDGTLVTHFCVVMKNCYLHSLTVDRIKNLSPIMELKENVTTLKTLEYLMQFTKSKTSFITSVLDDICKFARYSKHPNSDYYVNIGEKGCKNAINEHINHLFASLATVVENSISRSSLPADFNLPAYRESIKLEEIDLIAKTVSENLHQKPHNAMINIYSLKIKKSKDHCKRGLCRENLVEVEEQYEDVSYFREGISWYPIK